MEQQQPPPDGGLLEGVPQATFDMDSMIDETAAAPKQQYARAHVDPEAAIAAEDAQHEPPVDAAAQPTAAMSYRARLATSKFIMLQVDRLQASVFTLFGAKGHADDFRWNKEDRLEMAEYLEEGLPPDFSLPWYAKLGVAVATSTGANISKLQAIKEEKRLQAAQEEAQRNKEAREAAQADEDAALKAKFNARREARNTPAPEMDFRNEEEPDGCEECGEPTQGTNRFCGAKCRARANGRRSKGAPKKK